MDNNLDSTTIDNNVQFIYATVTTVLYKISSILINFNLSYRLLFNNNSGNNNFY